jgi:chromosome segregation ATPase
LNFSCFVDLCRAEAFKHNTERLVNDLTRTSKSAEEKLEVIEERSDQIIQESRKVQETISSIEMQADHLAEASKNVGDQIDDVLAHSKAIFEQSKEIADSQAKLREGQTEMRETIDAGMTHIQESYESLGNGMDKLKEEAVDIQREIKTVGDSMSTKMQDLQSTANDIGSVAGKSLENQMQLLDGQSKAMDGLNNLYSFQAQALEESRYFNFSLPLFFFYFIVKYTDFDWNFQGDCAKTCTVWPASAGRVIVQAGRNPASS